VLFLIVRIAYVFTYLGDRRRCDRSCGGSGWRSMWDILFADESEVSAGVRYLMAEERALARLEP